MSWSAETRLKRQTSRSTSPGSTVAGKVVKLLMVSLPKSDTVAVVIRLPESGKPETEAPPDRETSVRLKPRVLPEEVPLARSYFTVITRVEEAGTVNKPADAVKVAIPSA